jgi:hypothetical protein
MARQIASSAKGSPHSERMAVPRLSSRLAIVTVAASFLSRKDCLRMTDLDGYTDEGLRQELALLLAHARGEVLKGCIGVPVFDPKVLKQAKQNAVRAKNSPAKPAMMPNNAPPQDKIRERAYGLYESRGREPGLDEQDWFRAEKERPPRTAAIKGTQPPSVV